MDKVLKAADFYDMPLGFGKHEGKTLREVAQADREYLHWLAKQADIVDLHNGDIGYRGGIVGMIGGQRLSVSAIAARLRDTLEEKEPQEELPDVCVRCGQAECDGDCGYTPPTPSQEAKMDALMQRHVQGIINKRMGK